MPRKGIQPTTANPSTAFEDFGVKWRIIRPSQTEPLPVLAEDVVFENPKFIHRSYHSQVYSADMREGQKSTKAFLKIFAKTEKARYTKEVNAYRLLYHFGVPETGIVPTIYGVLPEVDGNKLDGIIEDEVPVDAPITLPASLIVMEYIEGERPSLENINPKRAIRILKALRKIQMAHILHGDTEGRNILVCPSSGRLVWIDFSDAEVNHLANHGIEELNYIQSYLFQELVHLARYIR
jgi:serine/threonine protein kinase